MIQRIQTLFLLLAFGLIMSMFYLPLAVWNDPESGEQLMMVTGLYSGDGTPVFTAWSMSLLFALTLVLILVDIFLYRRRILQMRVAIYLILILVGGMGLVAYYLWLVKKQLAMVPALKPALVFPLAAAVLIFLAYRNIKNDEELVRAYDRIR